MRLTLRTLIAWLDDTLTPNEVKTIGQQVSESPFAKELVERIHRVTRQRRLTVPSLAGHDLDDPNVVACYLDNLLSPDEVADYEKKCLTSDVHLAEVASVHQILSLIGHKAKVPADARSRMYRLIKGRETTNGPSTPPPSRPPAPTLAPKATVTEPIAAWSEVLPKKNPWLEKVGPAVAVLVLIAILGVTAIYSLKGDGNGDQAQVQVVNGPAKAEVIRKDAVVPEPAAVAKVEPVLEPATPPVEPAPDVRKAEEPRPGEVAVLDQVQGVVLRFNPARGEWERFKEREPIKPGARLLNLAPFRNTIRLSKGEVELVEGAEVVLDDADRDQAGRLELRSGQAILHPTSPSLPYTVRFEGQMLSITPPGGVDVGIERLPSVVVGQAEPPPARLRIFLPEGRATLRVGELEEQLGGPGEISLLPSGKLDEKARREVPPWVSEEGASPLSKEIGDQFVAFFRPNRPILTDLVEAMEDSRKDVKRMAVLALGALGEMESIVMVLNRKEDPTTHQAVVDVLRGALARGGEPAKAAREALLRQYDQPWAGVTEQLLIGYPATEAKNEATLAKLVGYLASAPGQGTRELALDNLKALTGRDSLEYDPEFPDGKGLQAWRDLLQRKELTKEARPAAPKPR